MARPLRITVALIGVIAAVATTGLTPRASADPLSTAKAQAAALTTTINQLQTQAEVASERYDQAESQLALAVSSQAKADQALTSVQAKAATAQQTAVSRVQALYESGGDSSALASLLTGESPNQALDGYHLATTVLNNADHSAAAATHTVVMARQLDAKDEAAAHRVAALQIARTQSASQVETLLASQKQALADTNGTIRRIVKADQVAAAAASAQDFVTAVQAAGGTLDLTSTPTPSSPVAAAAIDAARTRLGVPYVWGATGPNSFDCSGLTQWSYAHAGIALPRTAAQQWNSGPHPSLSALEPGDLLFWALDTSDPATIHHVAIYLGGGLMLAAPHTGENVQVQPVYLDGFIGATRPYPTTTTVTVTPSPAATPAP